MWISQRFAAADPETRLQINPAQISSDADNRHCSPAQQNESRQSGPPTQSAVSLHRTHGELGSTVVLRRLQERQGRRARRRRAQRFHRQEFRASIVVFMVSFSVVCGGFRSSLGAKSVGVHILRRVNKGHHTKASTVSELQ